MSPAALRCSWRAPWQCRARPKPAQGRVRDEGSPLAAPIAELRCAGRKTSSFGAIEISVTSPAARRRRPAAGPILHAVAVGLVEDELARCGRSVCGRPTANPVRPGREIWPLTQTATFHTTPVHGRETGAPRRFRGLVILSIPPGTASKRAHRVVPERQWDRDGTQRGTSGEQRFRRTGRAPSASRGANGARQAHGDPGPAAGLLAGTRLPCADAQRREVAAGAGTVGVDVRNAFDGRRGRSRAPPGHCCRDHRGVEHGPARSYASTRATVPAADKNGAATVLKPANALRLLEGLGVSLDAMLRHRSGGSCRRNGAGLPIRSACGPPAPDERRGTPAGRESA